jgi:putative chitinase
MKNYLKEFQTANGLVPDGVIGKNTTKVLMEKLGIDSPFKFAHFLAQCEHESKFTAGRENMNYSAAALKDKFGKYFKGVDINEYARQPEKIANRIYANRMNNGDESSGEGWKYRGVGPLQLTGKANIEAYLKSVNLPLSTDPEILLEPEHYFQTAKWFFDSNNVWQYCVFGHQAIYDVSRLVNLGNVKSQSVPLGIQERITLTNRYLTLLGYKKQ